VKPLEFAQAMGYITIGDKVDPKDYQLVPRVSAEEIVQAVLNSNLPPCAHDDQKCGGVILLHDGGGDRRETLRALPMLIDSLRARGYEIVPVYQLLGRTKADVMPAIS
jgi:peptidoglycan/xylan/chitin deacetylase (PgdA/CDA1 family)